MIYDEMRDLAKEILDEFKQGEIALIKVTPGTGPISDPGPSTETVIELSGATARGVKTKYVINGLANASDLQVTMHTKGPMPEQRDHMSVDGIRFKIKEIVALPAAGIPSVYVCILER